VPTLHILNKPPGHPRFTLCQRQLAEGDTLVLLEDAVLGFRQPGLARPGVDLFVLRADAFARGLAHVSHSGSSAPGGAQLLDELVCDMARVVDLCVSARRIVNW